jgi:hypothetical protein
MSFFLPGALIVGAVLLELGALLALRLDREHIAALLSAGATVLCLVDLWWLERPRRPSHGRRRP